MIRYSTLASTAALGGGIVAGSTLTDSIGTPIFGLIVGGLITSCAAAMFLIVVRPGDFIPQDK